MAELRIGVTGAAGRMGRILVRQVTETEGCIVAGASERPGHEAVGRDAGELAGIDPLGVAIVDDPVVLFAQVTAVLDFTTPDTACFTSRAIPAIIGLDIEVPAIRV